MDISESTLDDLMNVALDTLIREGKKETASRGEFLEAVGCHLILTNPLARLSRSEERGKLFSALGELFWYLSRDTMLDFIEHYVPGGVYAKESDDNIRVRSGYGQRLFSLRDQNQLGNVIHLLSEKASSRRAVIQIFDAEDLSEPFKSVPCTNSIQFLVRENELHLVVSMRSNDAYLGLPHDVFCFTMLQEIVARTIGVELGTYHHFVGSLHLYEEQRDAAVRYLDERWQSKISMPEMPREDPWKNIQKAMAVEEQARLGDYKSIDVGNEPYWSDICRLLCAYSASRKGDQEFIAEAKNRMSSKVYDIFLLARMDKAKAIK
ncbi:MULTISPECIES: thymidylate synthase [unclassified Pseudoxanthomonas]|uniref:thymidylate synthase n=1 Tax=unclassified Pseudoxanthomonas TaxID=2645906 RepID=UPI00307F8013